MATKSNSQRSRENRKKLEEAKKINTSSKAVSSNQTLSNSERSRRNRLATTINLDTLGTDLSTLATTIDTVNSGWQTRETMDNTRTSIQSMYDRLGKAQEYFNQYGGGVDLTETQNALKFYLDGWDDRTKDYGLHDNAESYNKAMKDAKAYAEERAGMKTADLGVVQTEIDDMKGILDTAYDYKNELETIKSQLGMASSRSIVALPDEAWDGYRKVENELNTHLRSAGYESIKELEEALGKKKQYKNQAQLLQNGIKLTSVNDENSEYYDPDYDHYVEIGKMIPSEEVGTKRIVSTSGAGKARGMRTSKSDTRVAAEQLYAFVNGVKRSKPLSYYDKDALFSLMTEEEFNDLAYYIAQDRLDGGNRTEEYVAFIKDELNIRRGEEIRKAAEGKTLSQLAFGIDAGLDQFYSGMQNLDNMVTGKDDYIPPSAIQRASAGIRTDLKYQGSDNKIIGNIDWGDVGAGVYDFTTTTTNMVPSILTSMAVGAINPTAGAVVGAGMMGASASGNAYQEMLNLGYDKNQARTYAAIVGVSEAGLQYALGGVGKLGGVSGKLATAVRGIENGFARFAIRYGGSVGAEALEEGLQEVLNPFFKDFAAGYDTGAEINWEEVAYSALLGGLSGGFLGGGNAAIYTAQESSVNKGVGRNIKANDRVKDVFDLADNPDIKSAYDTYTMLAKKGINPKNVSDYHLGLLATDMKADAEATIKSKKSTQEQIDTAKKTIADLGVYAQANMPSRTGSATNITKDFFKGFDERNIEVKDDEDNVTKVVSKLDLLIEEGLESAEGTESHRLATELKAKLEKGKKVSIAEIQKLYDANDQAIRAEETDDFRARLEEFGETEDVADIVTRKARGEILTTEEAEKVMDSENALKVIAEESNAENVTGELIEMAKTMDKEKGALFIALYDGKTDVEAYANHFNTVVAKAENGFGIDDLLSHHRNVLSGKQISSIFSEVRIKADYTKRLEFQKLSEKTASLKAYKAKIDDSIIDYNNTSAKGKINWNDSRITDRMRQAITFVKGFAQATGINLELITDGKERGFNGAFDVDNNTIILDIFAGIDVDLNKLIDAIIPTTSHELTHWMEKKSPVLYRKISRLVFSTLQKKDGLTESERIAREIKNILAQEYVKKYAKENPGKKISIDEALIEVGRNKSKLNEALNDSERIEVARSEIVARACEDMLSRSKVGREMFNSLTKTEQKTLTDKIKEIIQNLKDWVNDFLGLYKATSYEANVMREYEAELDKLSKLWDEMLTESVEVNQALEKSGEFGRGTTVESAVTETKIETETAPIEQVEETKIEATEETKESKKKSKPGIIIVERATYTAEGKVLKQARELQRKDPTKLTEDDFKNLLKFAKNKMFGDDTFIPARIGTPQILIDFAKEQGEPLENHPLAMRVYKARQALSNESEWDGKFQDKPHDLSVDEVVEIIKGMNNPSYLVYQTKNYRFAEIVKFEKDGEKEKAYAIIDFSDVEKNPDMMNGYDGGKYNILVTIYPSENSSELKKYLDNKNNIVMKGEEMKKKGLSQGSYGSYVPSLLNDSPFFNDSIPNPDEKVKRENTTDNNSMQKKNEIYLELAKDPVKNEARLREMVDEAAREAGYTFLGSHGTDAEFNRFDITKSRSWGGMPDYDLPGFYFAENAEDGAAYGKVKKYYLKISNPYNGDTYSLAKEKGSWRKAYDYLVERGYDGVIVDEFGEGNNEYIVLLPQNAKSADPVTYDDNGNIIPLSERFNPKKDDIRYSERNYSYNELIAKDDMEVVTLEGVTSAEEQKYKNDHGEFAKEMRKLAANSGNPKNTTTSTYLHCNDLDNDIMITRESFKHGAERMDNAYISVCKSASNVLKNAIVVNELTPRENTSGAYVLLGLAQNANDYVIVRAIVNKKTWKLEDYNELYSIRKKSIKKGDVGFKAPALHLKSGYGTSPKISISDFLRFVNSEKMANSVLSLDVVNALNSARSFDENVTPNLLFQDRQTSSVYDTMGETERVKKENEKLRADVERLIERLALEKKITNGNVFNPNQINAAAGHIRNIAKSNIDKVELMKSLKGFYSFIAESPELAWEDVFARAYRIAEDVLNEAKPEIVGDEYASMILGEIRNTRISLSDTQKAEAHHRFGNNWNRNFFGRANITNEGIRLESQWQEWAEMYPDIFDADISESEMVSELYDILGDLKSATETVAEYDVAEQTRWLATEIYNTYWNVSSIKTTADKYDKKIKLLNFEHRNAMKELRDDYNERLREKEESVRRVTERKTAAKQKLADDIHYGKKISKRDEIIHKLREKRETEVREAKEHGREMLDKYKENAERKTYIQGIQSTTSSLNKKLTTNSKDIHIPEELKPIVIKFINSVDMSSKQMLETGLPTKGDISTQKAFEKATNMDDENISLKDALDDVREMYEQAGKLVENTSDGTIDMNVASLDSSLIDMLKNVIKDVEVLEKNGQSRFVLREMSLENLKTLNMVVKNINHMAVTADKTLAGKHKQRISEGAWQTVVENDVLGKRQNRIPEIESVRGFLSWSQLQPLRAFERMGTSAVRYFDGLRGAQDTLTFNQDKIEKFATELFKGHDIQKWRTDIKEFDVTMPDGKSKKLRMPVSFIMSLYCVSKQEDAQRHLYGIDAEGKPLTYKDDSGKSKRGGGLTIADFKDGKTKITSDITNTLVDADIVKAITSVLTDEQIEIADELQKYMNTIGSKWSNSVSMALYGIKKFDTENYFPIKVSPNTIRILDGKDKHLKVHFFSILNSGFSKERNPKASQSIEIGDIFDVFVDHMSAVAIYNAYALPIYDIVRWYNFKGNVNGNEISVQTSLQLAHGKDALNYINHLLSDLNGQHESSRTGFISKVLSNTKVAMVGNSLSVVALQPTAYIKALTEINPVHLAKAVFYVNDFLVKRGRERAKEHCGIALHKSKGNFDTDISRPLRSSILNDDSLFDKAKEWSLWGAGKADEFTFGILWNACEFDIRAKRKDLKVGSDEYFEAVSEKLRDVLYKTQVVDSILTRSDIMRSPDGLAKTTTMFASELTVAYNMVHEAVAGVNLDIKRNGKKGWYKRSGKNLVLSLAAYTLTSAVSQAVYTAVQAFRDDEEDEKDFEDYMKMYFTNFILDFLIVGKIPYIKEVMNYAQGYSSTRAETLWMESAVKTVTYFRKAIDGDEGAGKKALDNFLKAISYLKGVPLYNAYRDAMAGLDFIGLLEDEDFSEWIDDLFD